MKNPSITILAMTFAIIILDYIWLGLLINGFIISQFGSLIAVQNGSIVVNTFAGVIVWTIIASGCYIFAVRPGKNIKHTTLLGATFGFICYAIYDLTNFAIIVGYPTMFIFVDIIWGTVLCAVISIVGHYTK
ncbi:DUF2177 family protein [Candidatus Woesearchaeota archaeon]|nr:DUF2177 family protein [Candidatus Woesearchaeota archaeon]